MSSVRSTLQKTHLIARSTASRATGREFDDQHLMQEVKQADVFHSETATGVERWQMVGMTTVPLKQEQEQQQKQSSDKSAETNTGDDWNHEQPKGKAAEAVMLYLNGQRSHPVAIVDDRRVRPYNMKEGEGAFYAADGSEQMLFIKEDGAYLVSLDGKSVKDKKSDKTRMASLRHVTKDMQSHEIKEGEKQQEYKHEGKTVNTEVRVTKNRIEFRAGDSLVGHYDKSSNTWELYESGGQGRVIINSSKVVGQFGDNSKSFRVDANHTHIKFGSNAIFVDAGGCWSTMPIDIKADSCS